MSSRRDARHDIVTRDFAMSEYPIPRDFTVEYRASFYVMPEFRFSCIAVKKSRIVSCLRFSEDCISCRRTICEETRDSGEIRSESLECIVQISSDSRLSQTMFKPSYLISCRALCHKNRAKFERPYIVPRFVSCPILTSCLVV